MCIAVCSCFFPLFTICSPAIVVPNARSGGHPKCIPSYIRTYLYIYDIYDIYILYIYYGSLEEPARASSPYFLRWHHLETHPCVFTDYRIFCSPAVIVLTPVLGPTAIEDGFRHKSIYVSMEWPVRASPPL